MISLQKSFCKNKIYVYTSLLGGHGPTWQSFSPIMLKLYAKMKSIIRITKNYTDNFNYLHLSNLQGGYDR